MKIRKGNRTGGRILAFLLSCCLLAGSVLEAKASPGSSDADEGALVLDKWVEEAEEAEDGFKLTLESYATGSNGTITTEPVPLDIVLVLDESGSMADVLIDGCNNENGTDVNVTPKGHLSEGAQLDSSLTEDSLLFVGHKVFSEEVDTSKTYTVVYPADGTTRDIYYCAECGAWYSNTNHADHPNIAKWIPFDNEDGTPTEVHEDGNWTCNVQFYERCGQTGRDLLQEALRSFLGTLYEASNPTDGNTVNNRVAIVGYGMGASYINADGSRSEVYADPGDGPGGDPVGPSSAASAWCNVASLNNDSIDTWVNGVHAEGSTPTHLGIEAAELAFDNAPPTEDENRAKVMILFTDGTPGADYKNYGPGASQYPDWVTPGIESANRMKDDGVTIYSVGLFPSANGYDAENISYNVNANGQGTPGFFANANCFLHLVSSNYPGATGVVAGEHGSLSIEYIEGTKSYYLGTSDATQLAGIFEQISQEVTPGSTTVDLDGSAIVKDKITSDFQITYTDKAANVTAYTMSYAGDDDSENKRWIKDEDSVSTIADADNPDKLNISVSGQTVSVTNFDFAGNFVHMDENGKPAGKKLVVEILIKPTDETSGGTKLPTNATSADRTDNAGIYGPDTDTPVAEFPLPHVDLSTTVTVKKVVEGIESTEKFTFDAEYVEAGDYENITAEESGGANDSNYLHFKDGSKKTDEFELGDGDTYKLENVEVGSYLTIGEEAAVGWIPTVTTGTGPETLTPDENDKYTVKVTPGMVITFTNAPETIDISGSKTWIDDEDKDGKRPASITIRLYADGEELTDKELTVTAENRWKWMFENLPKYDSGKKISYSISEDTVTGYTTTYIVNGGAVQGGNTTDALDISEDDNVNVEFINTYIPTADFAFQKTDADDNGLGGAYFGLYKLECSDPENHDHNNNLLTVDENGYLTGKYAAETSCWKRVDAENGESADGTGLVSFKDLETSAEYRLIEYKAPEGYVLPDGQWILKYDDDKDAFDITAVNESGTPAFEVSVDGRSFIPGQEVYYRVRNYQPGDLPFTGNIGIRLFLLIGGALMLFGAAGGTWYYMHYRRLTAVHRSRRRRRR